MTDVAEIFFAREDVAKKKKKNIIVWRELPLDGGEGGAEPPVPAIASPRWTVVREELRRLSSPSRRRQRAPDLWPGRLAAILLFSEVDAIDHRATVSSSHSTRLG